jgi:hypothetical protein
MSNYPNVSSAIYASEGDTIYIGLTNASNQDIEYGVGQNQNFTEAYDVNNYIGYCGKTTPYSFVATASNIIYFNINVAANTFIIC